MSAEREDRAQGWTTVPLGEIADIKLGKMLDRAKHTTGRKLPYLRNVNVRWGTIDTDDLLEMHFKNEELERFSVRPNDVLVCEGGEPGRAAVWTSGPTDLKFQKALHRVRFHVPFEPKLLVYYLEYLAKSGGLDRRFTGSTIKHFTREAFIQLPVPSMRIVEQKRVVAEIEKQFTRLDASVAALERGHRNLKRYRDAIRQAATEGLLGSDNAAALPSRWEWRRLDELAASEANAITDGPFGSNLKTEHYTDAGPRVLRLQNIGDGVFIDERAHVSDERFRRLSKHRVFAGDLVIAAFGAAPPRACIVPDALGDAIVKADCIRFAPDAAKVDIRYLNIALNSPTVRRRTKTLVHGVGRPRLNLGEIKSITVPLPSIQEQRRIAAEVERRLSVVDELERILQANLERARNLRQSILHRAFSGNL